MCLTLCKKVQEKKVKEKHRPEEIQLNDKSRGCNDHIKCKTATTRTMDCGLILFTKILPS